MERHFIIASHGKFAEGIYESVRFVLGEQKNVHIICGYVDDGDVKELIAEAMNRIPDSECIIALTDFFGGSINNEFMNYQNRQNFYIVAGMNLPLLIGILLSPGVDIAAEIETVVEQASTSIIFCNNQVIEANDEEDF